MAVHLMKDSAFIRAPSFVADEARTRLSGCGTWRNTKLISQITSEPSGSDLGADHPSGIFYSAKELTAGGCSQSLKHSEPSELDAHNAGATGEDIMGLPRAGVPSFAPIHSRFYFATTTQRDTLTKLTRAISMRTRQS
jgi:hypothetical protein